MNDIDDAEIIENSSHQLRAANQLPPDLMLMKLENESIMSVARAAPRDPKKIVKQLQELIDAYPEAADEAIYVKPVGTELLVTCGGCKHEYNVPYIPKDGATCPKCDSNVIRGQRKVKKFAEGLSIRAAESIRSIYGYNRLSVTMKMLPDGKVELQGVFVDYATGTMTADNRIVSPFYTDRFKKQAKHPEDRFLGVLVKAEKSKLRRDIILDSVPNTIKAAYRDCCEKKLAAVVDPDVVKKDILPWFAQRGLKLEHLEKIVGRPLTMGWTEQDRSLLKQIASALKNEETTVDELLADLDTDGEIKETAPPAGTAGGSGQVKPSDFQQPKAGTTKPKQSTPPAEQSAEKSSPSAAQSQDQQTDGPADQDDPTATPPSDTSSQAAPQLTKEQRWQHYADEFAKVASRTDLVDVKTRLRNQATNEDDKFEIDRLADVAKERFASKPKGAK